MTVQEAVDLVMAQFSESTAHMDENERRHVIAEVSDALREITADAVDYELED